MAAANTIQALYANAPRINVGTAIAARVALASVLYLVHSGNRRPGQRLLTATLAVLMVSGFVVSVSRALDPPPGVTDLVPLVATVCLGSAIALFWGTVQHEGEWSVLPPASPRNSRRGMAAGLLVLAFYFPFFRTGWLASAWASPLGVLPHQALLIGLLVAWASGSNVPRLPAWTLCCASILLGLTDVFAAHVWQGVPGLLGGAALAVRLYRIAAGVGLTNDDEPDVEKVARQRRAARDDLKEESQRVWKIK